MKKPAILITIPYTIEKWMEAYSCMLRNTDTGLLYIGQPNQQQNKNYEVVKPWLLSEEKVDDRNVPPALATLPYKGANHKTIAVPEHFPFDIEKYNAIIKNEGRCSVEWEENQCDGCKARIPMDGQRNTHKKPDDPTDPFGIGCTAHLYDRPKLTGGKITLYL